MESDTQTKVDAPLFTVTESAARRIDQLLLEDGSCNALRVAITGGGCAGFQYALGLDHLDMKDDDDVVITFPDAESADEFDGTPVTVLIDQQSLDYLRGARLDFGDGLMDKGFTVDNPNATSTCGCGTSFDAPEAPCRS
jgi:iron-sulfur cluster assembly accessory protein